MSIWSMRQLADLISSTAFFFGPYIALSKLNRLVLSCLLLLLGVIQLLCSTSRFLTSGFSLQVHFDFYFKFCQGEVILAFEEYLCGPGSSGG